MTLHCVLRPATLVALLAPFAASAGPQAPTTPVDADLMAFSERVRSCTPGSAKQAHPLVRGFTIEHEVTGQQDDLCDYSQTMPGGMRMHCRFDEAMRIDYADELARTAKTGAMSGSSSGPQQAWTTACEIETKEGKRLPMGSG